jgi:hypothetical protein
MSCNSCAKTPCGCEDTPLTSAVPCNSIDCPTPQPCSEVLDAQCVVYTGPNILCNDDVVVSSGATLAGALQSMITYFCTNSGGGNTAVSINANGFIVTSCINEDITLPENATVEYAGPLSMCADKTLTVPTSTTLTIL